MKMTKIALAIAALGAAPAAFALTPAQVDGTTVRLWLSGASAPTNAVFKGVATLCKGVTYKGADGTIRTNPFDVEKFTVAERTNDIHMFLEKAFVAIGDGDEPGKNAGDRIAYTCTIDTFDNRAGSLEGKKVVVYHTIEGGSFNAYMPHLKIAGDPLTNIPVAQHTLRRTKEVETLGAAGQCAAGAPTGTTVVDISGIPNNILRYNACATSPAIAFTAGQAQRTVATVNPNRPEGGFSDTEYLINKLNLDIDTDLGSIGVDDLTNIGQAFGVAVSYPLYLQLQKNDIQAGTISAGCDDNVAHPFNGGAATKAPDTSPACQPNMPAQRYTAAAYQAGAGAVNASLFGGGALAKVNLARRAITSGTQSASNLRFLSKPCATGVPGGALEPSRATDSTATFVVTENSSTGGVKTTLTNATTANEFGLGVVSMENVPVAGTDKWAFVKLDRVSPNSDSFQRAEAIDGSYNFWYELVAFTPTSALPASTDLIAGVKGSLGNPHLTNLAGLFITPVAGVSGSNVSKGYRAGNSCQPPVQ